MAACTDLAGGSWLDISCGNISESAGQSTVEGFSHRLAVTAPGMRKREVSRWLGFWLGLDWLS